MLASKDESALRDIQVKLASLMNIPQVKKVGFLLVAFHSVQLPLPDEDIAQLEAEGGLDKSPWQRSVEEDWVNPRNSDCRIRAC